MLILVHFHFHFRLLGLLQFIWMYLPSLQYETSKKWTNENGMVEWNTIMLTVGEKKRRAHSSKWERAKSHFLIICLSEILHSVKNGSHLEIDIFIFFCFALLCRCYKHKCIVYYDHLNRNNLIFHVICESTRFIWDGWLNIVGSFCIYSTPIFSGCKLLEHFLFFILLQLKDHFEKKLRIQWRRLHKWKKDMAHICMRFGVLSTRFGSVQGEEPKQTRLYCV